jgi:DNA-binding MarR family transcriptional regulator
VARSVSASGDAWEAVALVEGIGRSLSRAAHARIVGGSLTMPYLDVLTQALPFQSGSDTSRDAAIRAQRFVSKQGMDVLAWFRSRGAYGGTQREVSEALGIARASVAARVNALEKTGSLIKSVSERRGGCAVYLVTER